MKMLVTQRSVIDDPEDRRCYLRAYYPKETDGFTTYRSAPFSRSRAVDPCRLMREQVLVCSVAQTVVWNPDALASPNLTPEEILIAREEEDRLTRESDDHVVGVVAHQTASYHAENLERDFYPKGRFCCIDFD